MYAIGCVTDLIYIYINGLKQMLIGEASLFIVIVIIAKTKVFEYNEHYKTHIQLEERCRSVGKNRKDVTIHRRESITLRTYQRTESQWQRGCICFVEGLIFHQTPDPMEVMQSR